MALSKSIIDEISKISEDYVINDVNDGIQIIIKTRQPELMVSIIKSKHIYCCRYGMYEACLMKGNDVNAGGMHLYTKEMADVITLTADQIVQFVRDVNFGIYGTAID